MAYVAAPERVPQRVLIRIDALREHFRTHFDRGWLAIIIDDLPIDFLTIRRIRQVLSLTTVYAEDIPELRYGVEQLERFVLDLRRHLLPVLRERLGISGLLGPSTRLSRAERVHHEFLALAFPHNLSRLEELIAELRAEL